MEAIECLRVDIKTSSKESALEVAPLHKKIIEPVYKGHFKTVTYKVKNNSETARQFWVAHVKSDEYCEAIYKGPEMESLHPGE